MATIELKFEAGQKVWMMYNNKATRAPINQIIITENRIEYYFWHQDFSGRDENIVNNNTFRIDIENLFASKEELLNSL